MVGTTYGEQLTDLMGEAKLETRTVADRLADEGVPFEKSYRT